MNEPDVRQTVQRVARQHLETAHPERLRELDVVFDTAFATAVERMQRADASDQRQGLSSDRRHGLAFDASLGELGLVVFTVAVALQLVQYARMSRLAGELSRATERLRELPKEVRGFTEAQTAEMRQIVEQVVLEVATWAPVEQVEPLPVEALQLLVLRRERHGRPVLEFLLHGRSERGGEERSYDRQSFGEVVLEQAPAEYFRELFARMVMRDPTSAREQAAAASRVQQRGAFLFESLLSEELRAELCTLAQTGGSLLVISEEPWIPWELLRVPVVADGGEARFLAEAFALARWLPGGTPTPRLSLRRIALIRSGKAAVQQSGQEASVLAGVAKGAGRSAEVVEADSLALTGAMARGTHDAWHFIGHGRHSRAGAEWDELALDEGVLNPQDLSGEVAAGLADVKPFVFLNACHVGGLAQGLTGAGGWPARFLEVGAGAFLGALWAIPSDQAAAFAPLVYERLLAGAPIGEAVRHARLVLRDQFPGDATRLAYALYADPAAVSPPGGE